MSTRVISPGRPGITWEYVELLRVEVAVDQSNRSIHVRLGVERITGGGVDLHLAVLHEEDRVAAIDGLEANLLTAIEEGGLLEVGQGRVGEVVVVR